MLNHYVDRGIIKWSPFDALVGYHSMLEDMKYRLGKKEKPQLNDDEFDELNRKLQEASTLDVEIECRYYHDGYIRFTFGNIKKVDFSNRLIILSTMEKIKAEDILEIILP